MAKKNRTVEGTKRYKRIVFCVLAAMLAAGAALGISKEVGRSVSTSSIIVSKEADKGSVKDSPTDTDDAANYSGSSQVILSMGEEEGTMFISWKGDETGPRLIRYAQDKYSLPVTVPIRAGREKILKGNYYRYEVELTGLKPGRLYYYEIGDGTVYDSPGFFCAPKGGDDEDVFAYLGDPQFDKSVKDYDAWGNLITDMYERNPEIEFAVIGGDMVNIPTREDHWNGFLDNCGLFSMIPMMTIPGNHEGVTSNNTYKKLFHHISNGPDGEAFYWFDYGHCRFIMMDSSFLTKARRVTMGQARWEAKEKEVETWLRNSLENSNKAWNIVVIHHPVYGLHDMFTTSPDIRELWLPIMEDAGVDMVLCGHQHVYMRTRKMDGITHVMGISGSKTSNYYRGFNEPAYSEAIYSAGANYQVIKVSEKRIEITSYNEKGGIIDAAHIEKDIKFPYFRTSW